MFRRRTIAFLFLLSVLQTNLKKQTPNPSEIPYEAKSMGIQDSTHSHQPVGTGALVCTLPEIPITK